MMPRRTIDIKVLPGEPTDGTGRLCIHLWVRDPEGAFTEAHVMQPVIKDGVVQKGKVVCQPTRGRLACHPKRDPKPVVQKSVRYVTMRSDDPRAVTCPACIASEEYTREMQGLGE